MASDAKPVPGAEGALTAEERARCEEIARDHERYAANYHNNAFGHDASADEERCHFIARALRIAALRASPEPAAPSADATAPLRALLADARVRLNDIPIRADRLVVGDDNVVRRERRKIEEAVALAERAFAALEALLSTKAASAGSAR